ncbi:hypothetical protein SteCoe_25761 [Stentor coeruleus]|uniref:UDENN domain-containing protein n=1 Tax=Stentor coeruleus TaxID=5963 RepID=A0A1R2BEH7_9CILI|nr:hypothetical protein SteCoe_25761 [Stentor coeruleus]
MSENWEEKFNSLLYEYSLLSSEHNQLKLTHERLKNYSAYLEEENEELKSLIKNYKFPETLIKTKEISVSKSASISTLKKPKPFFPKIERPADIPAKALAPTKTPQPQPDNGIDTEFSTCIYEGFFVIGINPFTLKSKPQEQILFEYPTSSSISPAMKAVIPGLSLIFKDVRELKLTNSASELNNLIYGQIPSKRNGNCFIFTLRNETPGFSEATDLPNANREVVYFTCLLIEDITEHEGIEWVTSKCYCISSYVPAFELHYEVLCSILFLKRLYRMDIMKNLSNTENNSELCNINVTKEGIELLQRLGKIVNIEELVEVNLSTTNLDCLKFPLPIDISTLDIPWLCVPLFSSLPFKHFCWLIAALVQEKSVIFASYNLGLVTSCVLAMRALIRPLNWTSLTIPLIPDDLRELLEAPVPVLAGINNVEKKIREKFSNIIWVMLDEQNVKNRVQYYSGLASEVAELEPSLMNQIKEDYIFDGLNMFDKVKENQDNAVKIAMTLRRYWKGILDKFSLKTIRKVKRVRKVVDSFVGNEKVFVEALASTQMFANSFDD